VRNSSTASGHALGSDERLSAALEEASLPTLLMVLAQLTGDGAWLNDPYRPKRGKPLDDNDSGGLPEQVQREIRAAAYDAILKYRQGALKPQDLTPERVAEMLGVSIGEEVPREYGPLLAEEMGLVSRDVEIPRPAGNLRVLVIGAGLAGLCAAIKLQAAGIEYAVVEKNPGLGGTWFENVYPGCGVDTPSHFYSFTFAPNAEWSHYFAKQGQVREYLERIADDFGVRRNIRFKTEVTRADYDAATASWQVRVRESGGAEEVLTAAVVICAVGMVNRPFVPPLPGLDTFAGPAMHTARWRDDVPLEGRRVAVVGNGASAMQLVPAIVNQAERVLVFQRSQHWALPHPNYHRAVSGNVRLLMDTVPYYAAWYRLRAFWNYSDRLHPSLQIDPDWPHPERSVNASNESHRVFLTRYIESELSGREDLIKACVPPYPPYGKRPLIDNGWYRTLRRDDVQLVTEAVTEVREHSVVTASGAEFDADVLVLATGFRALQFLWPMEIRGRSGRTLRETWGQDDARAYLGMTVPDFPNFFIVNGPNTNAGHGGSAVISVEFQVRYIMQLLREMVERDHVSIEVREDVFWDYNKELDHALSRCIWVHPGMTTYYRNDAGRVVLSSPWKYIDYWHRTLEADLAEYQVEREPARPADRPRVMLCPRIWSCLKTTGAWPSSS